MSLCCRSHRRCRAATRTMRPPSRYSYSCRHPCTKMRVCKTNLNPPDNGGAAGRQPRQHDVLYGAAGPATAARRQNFPDPLLCADTRVDAVPQGGVSERGPKGALPRLCRHCQSLQGPQPEHQGRLLQSNDSTTCICHFSKFHFVQVRLPTPSIESFTEAPPSAHTGMAVDYGPYEDVAPFTMRPVQLHFDNDSPFVEVLRLEREVEVSHWGNVYVEENYVLEHAGARHRVGLHLRTVTCMLLDGQPCALLVAQTNCLLDEIDVSLASMLQGEWSRLDMMKGAEQYGRFALTHLTATLPKGAHSLYYRDTIGNISTSDVRAFPGRARPPSPSHP